MRRMWSYVIGVVVLVLLAIQLVPAPPAHNPAVEEEVTAPLEVMTVLRRSCYDCHSHETRWPWYASVAPAKWLVRRDVAEAREELNFSAWNRYDAEERAHNWEEVAEELEEGNMPLWYYLPLHRDAALSGDELEAVRAWAISQSGDAGSGDREVGEPGSP
jgi:hypothetical protein